MSGVPGPSEGEPTVGHTSWLAGGGEMGDLIRAFDWSQTPIGCMDGWSPTLRTMVSMMLANRFPLLLWWGPDYVSLYNDAYRPVLGTKHSWALGRPVRECWSEIWHVLKPLIDAPFQGGPATWNEDIELEINRHGFLEETHFTIAYSPVPDATAPDGIGGVLATVTEITDKVVAERRVVILRDLAARTGDARTAARACEIAAETLATHAKDVPFALLYLVEATGKSARLAGTAGLKRGLAISPERIALNGAASPAGWPLPGSTAQVVVDDLAARFPEAEDLPHTAAILPFAGFDPQQPAGYLVVGANPRLRLDHHHDGFLQLMKAQVASAVTNARSYEEERRRSEALAELDRAKTVFFSNVSHEFRTPLTLMLGHIEDILSGSVDATHRERLTIAYRNTLRLLKLVNTLLEFSRIEAGRMQAAFERTDLAVATTELVSVFRSATEKAGLKLVVDTPPLAEPAWVDRQMWEKVVLNLLSNAFKFTLRGEIAVALHLAEGGFVLSVRDTGIGIPDAEMPRLFERFHRVEGAEGRTQEGSGIGLAFIQELVRLHGGEVSADSRLGQGTTFRVTIPRGSAHLPARQVVRGDRRAPTGASATSFIEEALRWVPAADGAVAGVPEVELAASPIDPHGGRRARVLVVDDNADMRDYLRRLLAPHYALEVVGDGHAALAASARQRPDLVLTDIMIPGQSGLELLQRLRADPATSTIPVILLSARAGEESRVDGMRAGADDYLIKPFSARELLARVEAHVKMARYRVQATEALQASEERYRAFVTASSDAVYRMSPDWREMRYAHGNDFIADTDNPSATWLARYIDPADHARVTASVADAIRNKTLFELEHRVIRVDGTLGWTHSRAIPIVGADGNIVEWFGTAHDITDRKQGEETRQLLLNELSHRVKNMLAAIHAMAQQTLRKAKDPAAFAESFGGRLQSMARMHSLLTSTGWEGADFREIIRDQLQPGAVDDGRVIAAGPPVRLDAQAALHAAMMLHELGTNSVKYGGLSRPDGSIAIRWSVDGDGLRLDWTERNGPPVKTPVGRGFGTTLIEQTVQGQGGSARRSIHPEGMQWEIVIPLAGGTEGAYPPAGHPGAAVPGAAGAATRANVRGRRFAVIEDEPLIAINIAAVLEQEGAQVSGPVATVGDALRLIEAGALDGALVDANLRGHAVGEIGAALMRKGIPFVFVTGYGPEALPAGFAGAQLLRKPFTEEQLRDAAARLVAQLPAELHLRR